MNEQYLAMRELAALRDGLVLQLFVTALVLVTSHGLLQAAALPVRVRTWLINTQLAVSLLAWCALIVVLGFVEA